MGLVPKYYLLAGYTNQLSIFLPLHQVKTSKKSWLFILFYRDNVNHLAKCSNVYTLPVWEYCYKSVHQPLPTRENWEHPGNSQNKSGSSAFNWVLPFYFLKWNCYFSACKRQFLESTSQFSFKFFINLQYHQT